MTKQRPSNRISCKLKGYTFGTLEQTINEFEVFENLTRARGRRSRNAARSRATRKVTSSEAFAVCSERRRGADRKVNNPWNSSSYQLFG